MVDEAQAQRWENLARSAEAWLDTARILRACAETIGGPFVEDIVKPPPPPGERSVEENVPPILFGFVFQMLAGYTIEALLKGILVARYRDAVTEGRLATWLTKHNLENLLTRAGITLDDPLLAFIRRVNVAVVWSGRYPVPKERARMEGRLSSSADLEWFEDIYHRLYVRLQIELDRTSEVRDP